jgi:cardiolipin synthase A/B
LTSSHYIPPAASASYPARPGNVVRPLIGGAEMFGRIGEAIDKARHSIWATIAFYAQEFCFPDGRGALFDALDRAVARGVDVRLLIWRPREGGRYANTFGGAADDRERLRRRGTCVRIRWDRATGPYCQHQKSWIIDAGQESETAFLGGANLSTGSFRHHDVYLELIGPSAADVHHNFVQRWNEASERTADDGCWACTAGDNLGFPGDVTSSRGPSLVQIQRMVLPQHYTDGHPAAGCNPFDVAAGERSILEQYQRAIDAARHTIYLENQAIPIMDVAAPLARALDRGVDVILLTSVKPEEYVYAARHDPSERPRFEGIEALGRHPNFLMAGLAGPDGSVRDPIYVHAKLMLVDDAWATIGSCNLHRFSLAGHTEMNAAIWDASLVGALRRRLFAQHLGAAPAGLAQRAAFQRYVEQARENRRRLELGDILQPRAVLALDPERYAVT